ncbi:MAG: Na/Pi cotransporter family protein [Prolixibacteraceae bacterium]|nr:Na/Pi cotransporter family protein [Prolixibacteraceae bacterium]
MNYTFFDFLKLIGSLGFFLFGMKMMSEALQKVAGEKMRMILGAMTSNRFKGILTGLFITAVIQSSSATTVMVVSFVNAGLLSLNQSIGVIMGANIGTTVTAWLISLLGFKVDVSVFALPLIGVAIPFIFSKKTKRSSMGQLIIGFSILFMGLDFLKDSVPDIKGNPEILNFISEYSALGIGSTLLFLLIGTILTIIIQSSSAVMAVTLVMCFNGWISFEMAAAMVLGENIGTTITANLAAMVVNNSAKRAARAHFLFNLTGVILVLIFFQPFMNLINSIMEATGLGSPLEITLASEHGEAVIPIALSVFHTSFNVLNTLLQVWFVPYIARIVIKMVPGVDEDDEIFKLKYIKTGLVSVDELAIIQAKNEISVFIERSQKMYSLVKNLLEETSEKQSEKVIRKIRKYEEISDRIEVEIANYLTRTASSEISKQSSETINTMLKLVSRIESLNDALYNTAELLYLKYDKKMVFNIEMNEHLYQLTTMIDLIMSELPAQINKKNQVIDIQQRRIQRDEISAYIEKLNLVHLKDIKKGVYKYKVGIVYCDIFNELESVGNHAYHILKYINEFNNKEL